MEKEDINPVQKQSLEQNQPRVHRRKDEEIFVITEKGRQALRYLDGLEKQQKIRIEEFSGSCPQCGVPIQHPYALFCPMCGVPVQQGFVRRKFEDLKETK